MVVQIIEERVIEWEFYSSHIHKTVEGLSELAKGRLKNKKEELKKSFNSRVTEHHLMLIEMSLKHIEYIEGMMVKLEGEMDELIKKQNLANDLELLDTIPGVDKIAATARVAEIGADMSKFRTDAHISSWAGMSPGNNESAGKKKAQGPRMETYG